MHGKFARKAASEGIVLLKNEANPSIKERYSCCTSWVWSRETVKGGIGSEMLITERIISIYQGLKEAV